MPVASPTKKPLKKKPVTTKTATKSVASKSVPDKREPVYPVPKVGIMVGDKVLTSAMAKEFLGWQEEIKNGQFTKEDEKKYLLFRDLEGKRIRCDRNGKNRRLVQAKVDELKQEILQGNYQLNMENIIIGIYGNIVSGQHRLIALIFAVQEWHKAKEKYPFWKSEPTIATTVAYGCSEEDKVINTIDTGTPRSVGDVIYRSDFFSKYKPSERNVRSRRLEKCVNFLWFRMAVKDISGLIRTHAESLDFIARHPRMIECVNHITDEDGDEGKIKHYISPGVAAGLLYLMASSATERHHTEGDGLYGDKDITPTEDLIDWENWDKAMEFWVVLATGKDKTFAVFKQTFAELLNTSVTPSLSERVALIIKAWLCFIEKEKISAEAIALKYKTFDDALVLDESPSCGGCDCVRPTGA